MLDSHFICSGFLLGLKEEYSLKFVKLFCESERARTTFIEHLYVTLLDTEDKVKNKTDKVSQGTNVLG